MLKDAGTDRFSVPERLMNLDADRIDDLGRIYQQQAVVAARHVDALRSAELHLHDRSWSARLDDELAARLPWTPEVFEKMSAGARSMPDTDVNVPAEPGALMAIRMGTPFLVASHVAALAMVLLGDPTMIDQTVGLLRSEDLQLRTEAALVLSSWRVRTTMDLGIDDIDVVAALQCTGPHTIARVRLAYLSASAEELPPDELLLDDDAKFQAALLRGDVDTLASAARGSDSAATIAAARSLVAHGTVAALDHPLRHGDEDVQREVVDALSRSRQPCDELHEALVALACTAHDLRLRQRATSVAGPTLRHDSALRIAHAVPDGPFAAGGIWQALLQNKELGADTIVAIADLMIDRESFSMRQFGMNSVADDGRLPDHYAPARFGAASERTRIELLALAERQLGQRADPALHRFVLGTLFGGHPASTCAAAMWTLRRWYKVTGDIRGEGPFVLTVPVIQEFFGRLDRFVAGLVGLLGDDASMCEVGVYDYVAHLLGTADEGFIAATQADQCGRSLIDTLSAAALADWWPSTMEAIWTLMSRLALRPDWRAPALEALRGVDRIGNYHYDAAIVRLESSTG